MPAPRAASLVDQIDHLKTQFDDDAGRQLLGLLRALKSSRVSQPEELIRLHEALLFLRAYPRNPQLLHLAEQILDAFGGRLKSVTRDELEYDDVSGISQTSVSTAFSHPFALSLATRHARQLDIDWDRYEHPERLGRTLSRLIPDSFEDWAIQPHADWRRWYENKGKGLLWLLERIDPEVYDLLEIPLRWNLGNSAASRTRLRIPRSRIFYHDGPLLARRDVSLASELAQSNIVVRKVSLRQAKVIFGAIIDASAVRYRELYGFEYPDFGRVFHANLGRGMDFYFCGLSRRWKLPHREYMSGMYFKNGVPTGYVEVMWKQMVMEVGFNLYYTFRQGETAWLYARLLKLFHQRYGVTRFAIDPYQLGHENEEAIASGAFWFYYKLGFRPTSPQAASLAMREFRKINDDAEYRSSARKLRLLASSSMVYSIERNLSQKR